MTSDEYKEERGMALAERTIERLWILTILLVFLLVGSNGAWLYYENSFENTEITQDVDTGNGDATVTGIEDNPTKTIGDTPVTTRGRRW